MRSMKSMLATEAKATKYQEYKRKARQLDMLLLVLASTNVNVDTQRFHGDSITVRMERVPLTKQEAAKVDNATSAWKIVVAS